MIATMAKKTIAKKWRLRLVPSQRIEGQPLITPRSKYGMVATLESRWPHAI